MPVQVTARHRKQRFVFVPGLGTDGSAYKTFLDAFRSEYDVQSADLAVRFPQKLSWQFFFSPIDRAINRVTDQKPVILIGHSMGGSVALKYAASHPGRVERVIAIAPVLFPFKRVRHRTRENLHNSLISLTGGHPLHALRIRGVIKRRTVGGRARKLYDFVDTIDLAYDLPKLRQAAILFPEHEEVTPRAHFEQVSQEFPKVRTVLILGSHHNIALAPKRVIEAVKKELHA